MSTNKVIYKAELNCPNDWRVVEYINNEFHNDRECRNKTRAIQRAKELNDFVARNNIESSLFDK